ncbi:PRC-barrel domain protein [Pseudobythopirellula maris]|uniref:PRC-barrel domain protein n=1 Tax=Pseudobythopirellula maris TaxID=2527991 RepID=A0A5C5ZSM0_9BACT|nr:PRC-barrel domain-containing protein [Pseudobythopirellula maris]TWT90055.1 PRC-barrel domain protein [Pseudobythopirellula maris]
MRNTTLMAIVFALGFSPMAMAQQTITQRDRTTPHAQTHRADKPDSSNYDSDRMLPQGLVRASELMNKAVYNNQEDQVATVYDVVLSEKDGKVAYVAISTGGFLGMGDKLFAVPHNAFSHKMMDGEKVCTLDATEETFENNQGFDQDNWPTKATKNWKTNAQNTRPERMNHQQNNHLNNN